MEINMAQKKETQKIKHLDFYVKKTLASLERWRYPELKIKRNDGNVFLGSGTAACVGKLFAEKFNGISLNASNYKRFFKRIIEKNFASLNIISASGGKDSVNMASFLAEMGLEPNLITCNKNAPAQKFVKKENIFVFPSFLEPPTYNVSTYGSMVYWLFKEDLKEIKRFLEDTKVPDLRRHKYIFFLAADQYDQIAEMASRKVAETLGGVGSNSEGFSNAIHGMLRQPNKDRLVFCLNQRYLAGDNIYKLEINSYLGLMLGSYYIIGKNQTDSDTKNLLKNYEETSKKLGWKFNKVW